MVTSHLYVGFQYKTNDGFVDVNPFFVIPSGTYNGRNQYQFYYTIDGIYYSFLIQWIEETWETTITSPISASVAKLPDPYTQEQYPGVTSPVNWLMTPEYPADIYQFYTYIEEVVLPDNTVDACTYWYSAPNNYFPIPWQNKVWYMMSNGEGLFAGQVITTITFDNGAPEFAGTGVYHIGAILYCDETETLFSTTQSSIYPYFVGIIVMDSNNNYVLPVNTEESYNQGTICLAYTVPPTEEEIQIECYKKAVWSKQCQYSALVQQFQQAMVFGTVCCDMLENLKQKRRILNILNSYDVRDIFTNTNIYNNFTYTQIQQLLTL